LSEAAQVVIVEIAVFIGVAAVVVAKFVPQFQP
jgi:hypothetical protein